MMLLYSSWSRVADIESMKSSPDHQFKKDAQLDQGLVHPSLSTSSSRRSEATSKVDERKTRSVFMGRPGVQEGELERHA